MTRESRGALFDAAHALVLITAPSHSLTKTEVNVKLSVDKLIGAKARFDKLGVTPLAKTE